MPAIIRSYEWATHDHGISQNGRKTQQNGPVAHLTDGKKRQTHTISCHRTVIRKVHHLLGQKIDLRYPRAYLQTLRSNWPSCRRGVSSPCDSKYRQVSSNDFRATKTSDGRTLPLSCGPQSPRPGTTTKPALWAVSSSGLILIEAPSPADHRGLLRVGQPWSRIRRRPQCDFTTPNTNFTAASTCTPPPCTPAPSTRPKRSSSTAICNRPRRHF